jgi:hypothetical protein
VSRIFHHRISIFIEVNYMEKSICVVAFNPNCLDEIKENLTGADYCRYLQTNGIKVIKVYRLPIERVHQLSFAPFYFIVSSTKYILTIFSAR